MINTNPMNRKPMNRNAKDVAEGNFAGICVGGPDNGKYIKARTPKIQVQDLAQDSDLSKDVLNSEPPISPTPFALVEYYNHQMTICNDSQTETYRFDVWAADGMPFYDAMANIFAVYARANEFADAVRERDEYKCENAHLQNELERLRRENEQMRGYLADKAAKIIKEIENE